MIVDYRRVNAALQRAIYYIRRREDVKQELAGLLFYSTVDGLKGFNLLENTDLAAQVLAVLSDLGCLLARVLQLGPCNGPFDFQYVVDDLFSLGPEHPKWFGRAWKILRRFCRPKRALDRRRAPYRCRIRSEAAFGEAARLQAFHSWRTSRSLRVSKPGAAGAEAWGSWFPCRRGFADGRFGPLRHFCHWFRQWFGSRCSRCSGCSPLGF